MKDAYSFDVDEEGCKVSYSKMYKAYNEIFDRLGLKYKVVEADSGAIGGNVSHEFMVLADTGEDSIIYCDTCGYAANLEKAVILDSGEASNEVEKTLEEVATPSMKSVDDVANCLGLGIKKIVKTLIFKCSKGFFAVLVRGDYDVNLIKIKNIYAEELPVFANEEEILHITGGPLGFSGPVGLNIPTFADNSIKYMKNFVTGANKKDTHLINVNFDRDFETDGFFDLRNAKDEDNCAKCEGKYKTARGIEVGHIFMLGTKYSSTMNACFLDEKSQQKPFIMGCYGIGIGRIAAAAIEQNYDDKGIIWPVSIAPFEVTILTLSPKDEKVLKCAEVIYKELLSKGVDVLYDDRNERAGVKFNDADLVGYPVRINVGRKLIDENKVEIFVRKNNKSIECSYKDVVNVVVNTLEKLKSQ
jgi:prolyl-tRNA synthetase